MRHFILLALLLLQSLAIAGGEPRLLPTERIEKLKKGPCTFFHVWAVWCTVCVQEMPELIPALAAAKKATVVVIDASKPFQQDNFAKKWKVLRSAPFPTYLKPAGEDKAYLAVIDANWSGALPYSALYQHGKKTKTWVGALDPAAIGRELNSLCR